MGLITHLTCLRCERLGEVAYGYTKVWGSLIFQLSASRFQFTAGAHQAFEAALEVLGHVEPMLGIDLQPLQYRRLIGGYMASFVFPDGAPGPIDKLKIVFQSKR
jgi:hypothetical protein